MLFKKELPFVLSDCDGTIALPDFTINKDTIKDVQQYQKKSGYKFSIITGRNFIVNKQSISDLKIQLPVISCNGSLITDPKSGEVLYAEYLDPGYCVQIFRKAQEIGLDIIAYTPDALVGTKVSNRIQAWNGYKKNITNKKDLFNITTFNDLNELADAVVDGKVKPVELVIVAFDEHQKEKMLTLFKNFEDKIDLIESMKFMFTGVKKGINKGTGLAKWAEIVNVELDDVVVFGDNYNDVSMFKEAKRKYAVGNAVDALKKEATAVVDTVQNNGVGKELERIMNND